MGRSQNKRQALARIERDSNATNLGFIVNCDYTDLTEEYFRKEPCEKLMKQYSRFLAFAKVFQSQVNRDKNYYLATKNKDKKLKLHWMDELCNTIMSIQCPILKVVSISSQKCFQMMLLAAVVNIKRVQHHQPGIYTRCSCALPRYIQIRTETSCFPTYGPPKSIIRMARDAGAMDEEIAFLKHPVDLAENHHRHVCCVCGRRETKLKHQVSNADKQVTPKETYQPPPQNTTATINPKDVKTFHKHIPNSNSTTATTAKPVSALTMISKSPLQNNISSPIVGDNKYQTLGNDTTTCKKNNSLYGTENELEPISQEKVVTKPKLEGTNNSEEPHNAVDDEDDNNWFCCSSDPLPRPWRVRRKCQRQTNSNGNNAELDNLDNESEHLSDDNVTETGIPDDGDSNWSDCSHSLQQPWKLRTSHNYLTGRRHRVKFLRNHGQWQDGMFTKYLDQETSSDHYIPGDSDKHLSTSEDDATESESDSQLSSTDNDNDDDDALCPGCRGDHPSTIDKTIDVSGPFLTCGWCKHLRLRLRFVFCSKECHKKFWPFHRIYHALTAPPYDSDNAYDNAVGHFTMQFMNNSLYDDFMKYMDEFRDKEKQQDEE